MKRKTYTTDREQKTDQIIGFVSFFIINACLLAIYFGAIRTHQEGNDLLLLLPWVANGGFVTLAFIFRPQIGVGYLAGFFIPIVVAILLGVLFAISCFIAVVVTTPLAYLDANAAVLVFILPPVLFLIGLYVVGRWTVAELKEWWRAPK